MKKMSMIQAVFSPTGGTQAVADAIAGSMPMQKVDLCGEVEAQAVGVPVLAVLPVYGGRLPEIAVERLRHLKGQGQAAVAVVVYGNRAYEDALAELKNELTGCGFRVIAAAAFIAEHSIVCSVATGRPDTEDKLLAAEFGRAVAAKLVAQDMSEVTVPGGEPYRDRPVMPVVPLVLENCGACGKCARLCPVGAIPLNAPNTTDAEKCILCMRCVSVCPRRSRLLPTPVLSGLTQRLQAVAAERKLPQLFV